MATKTVQWVSCANLSCAAALPADVILCTNLDFSVVAQIIRVQGGCGCQDGANCWRYTFLYEETPAIIEADFGSQNITGAFCAGCLTEYIAEQTADVFNEITYLTEHNFLAAPDTPVTLSLSVVNPSATKSLQAQAQWGFVQNFVSTQFGDLTGVSLQLYIDGNPIPIFVNQSAGITVPPVDITTGGGTGVYPFVVAAGATSLVTLTFTPFHGALLPDTTWRIKDMFLSVYGVTT